MGCMESKDTVRLDEIGVERNLTPNISYLHGTKSYTYTFNQEQIPSNYTVPEITVTDSYTIGGGTRDPRKPQPFI
jgi:hypothetical protein